MKKSTIIFLAALVSLALFSILGTAQASCYQYGYVIRVLAYPGTTSSNYIYLRTSSTTNLWYYARTTDAKLTEAAATALTNRTRVYINANATSCPTSGTARYMGNVTSMILSP